MFYKGNISDAEKIFTVLYSDEPENFDINLFLARIKRNKGEFYQTLDFLSKAFNIKKNSELFIEFAGIELELGNNDTSYNMLINALKYSPDSFNIFVSIIENLILSSRFEEAEYYVDVAEKKFGKGYFLRKSKVRILKAENKLRELEDYYKQILNEDRDNHEYVIWYAGFLIENFRFKEAKEILEKNIERFTKDTMVEYNILDIRVDIELKRYTESEKRLLDAIYSSYPDYRYYIILSYLYTRINNFGMAEKYMSAAQNTGKAFGNWMFNYIRGYLYYKAFKLDEALEYLEKALVLNPDFPYTRYYIADIYIKKRMYFSASRELKIIMDYWDNFEYIEDVYKKYRELK